MCRLLMLGAAVVLGWAGVGFGQVVYLPVQVQYQVVGPYGQGATFYYGGTNPDVYRYASWPGTTRDGVVYSDWVSGPQDARLWGYGVSDAQNEAYQNVPRYFNKRDILRQAVRQQDGTWAVPAQAGELPREADAPDARPTQAQGTSKSGVILIIPKKKAPTAVKPAMFVSAR